MFSLRSTSLVAAFTFAAFGLMGCAASSFQAVGQPQTGASVASSYDPSASYDPSSLYQPSPNVRAVAAGNGSPEAGTRSAHCTDAEVGSVGVSPNARLCP
ncbi:hypothetical protein LVJ94_10555 [Pendulispora rubella]|uniref:Lipoprotein n=1 Tax=Pendulispora rubella TaxID=2741070 RepID=A0ABZ2L9S2_9BACT